MSWKSKSAYKTDTTNIKSLNAVDGKIDATELTIQLNNLTDSVVWQDAEQTLTDGATVTMDYNLGAEAIVVLGGNRNLSIINLPTDRICYGIILKLGSFTLTLPTGKYSTSGNVTGIGRTLITFRSNGTDIDFSFATSAGT